MRYFLTSQRGKAQEGGEMSNIRCSKGQRNLIKYYGILTKLIPLNTLVTLSQVPLSQKETQGLEAHCVSTCVLTQTPRGSLWLMGQPMFCVDLVYQPLSNADNALKGLQSGLDEGNEIGGESRSSMISGGGHRGYIGACKWSRWWLGRW